MSRQRTRRLILYLWMLVLMFAVTGCGGGGGGGGPAALAPTLNQPGTTAVVNVAEPNRALVPAIIEFSGVSYDGGNSTFCYSVTSSRQPSISHWDIGFDCTAPVVLDASEQWEWTEDDPTTGIHGIKFDTGYNDLETREVCFTLQGLWDVGTVAIAIKAGLEVEYRVVEGPLCGGGGGEPPPPPPPPPATCPVGSYVFFDILGDGAADGPDYPLVDVQVDVTGSGSGTGTYMTDGSGMMIVELQIGESYTITVTPLPGHFMTTPAEVSFILTEELCNMTYNFGMWTGGGGEPPPPPATCPLSAFVFFDFDANGVSDGDDSPQPNVQIDITGDGAGTGTYFTNVLGHVGVELTIGSSYTITATAPAGYILTTPAQVDFTLTEDLCQSTFNFGVTRQCPITSHVFFDLNEDGMENGDDYPMSGVQVDVTGNGVGVGTYFTDGSGNIALDVTWSGSYNLHVVAPAGYELTTPADIPLTITDEVCEGVFNFGLIRKCPITSRVFFDLNADGMESGDDYPMSGVQVDVTGNGIGVGTYFTDGSGNIALDVTWSGSYNLHVIAPAGYELTTPADIPLTITDEVCEGTFRFGLIRKCPINAYVFFDFNADGVENGSDHPLPSIQLDLSGNGVGTGTYFTSAGGSINVEVTWSGTYTLVATPPAGYELTTPAEINFSVTDDVCESEFRFGMIRKCPVTSYVFFDIDGDGVADPDEPPLPGVQLDLSGNGIGPGTYYTDAAGNVGVMVTWSGSYTFMVHQLEGFILTSPASVDFTVTDDVCDSIFYFGMKLDDDWICNQTANGFTIGFWKNNLDKAVKGRTKGVQVSASDLQAWTTAIGSFLLSPLNVGSMQEAIDILSSTSEAPVDLLAKQLMGSEYNYMSGAYIGGNQLVTSMFLYEGEWLILHAGEVSAEELLSAKDMYENYNNSHGGLVCPIEEETL